MKKSIMQQLKAKTASHSRKATLQVPEAESTFKVNVKHVHAMVKPIIEHIRSAHVGLRDVLLSLQGEHPLSLEAALKQIKDDIAAWLKTEGRKINPQSVYNMVSDVTAAIRAFQRYAGMSKPQQATFNKSLKAATGYHSFIRFCRATVKGKKAKAERGGLSSGEKRIAGQWKNHKRDALKTAKDWVRFADTDSILALLDFAESIVTARKKGNVLKMDGYLKAQQAADKAKQERKAA